MPSIIDLIKSNGDLEEITTSLELNSEQCSVITDGEFPLLIASQYGRLDVVKLLVANDYINDIKECFEIACLAHAGNVPSLYRGSCLDVAFFLIEIMEELDLIRQYGASLLLVPAQIASFDIFEKLITRIEHVNLPRDAYQPLMAAVIGRDPKIVELLLDAGADITLQKDGFTALAMVYKMEKENGWGFDCFSDQIVNLLEAESSRIFEESLASSLQDVDLIVANDYINDIKECFEIACLAHAGNVPSLYRGSCLDVAFFLIEIMEELDLIRQYGASLLLAPAQTASFDIFEKLITRIEHVNLPRDTYQPLMAAVIGRDPKIVELLLDAGADITLQKYGFTALAMAYKIQKENGWELDCFSEKIITLLEAESSRIYEDSLELSSQDVALIGDEEACDQ